MYRLGLDSLRQKDWSYKVKLALLSVFLALPLLAQSTPDLRVTAQTLSGKTTSAMFGRLPKAVTAAAVQVCSNLPTALTIPQARIVQQVKAANGYTILPKDSAIVVIAESQGKTKLNTSLRVGLTAVELAAIASGWSSLSVTIKNTLTSAALSGASALNVFSQELPTHTYLTFASEMLPDPIVLPPGGCSSGFSLVESNSDSKAVDFPMTLPQAGK